MDQKRKEELNDQLVNRKVGELVGAHNREEMDYIMNYINKEPKGEGRKDDTDKLRFDLLPVKPLFEFVRLWTLGAKKYSDRNWEKGLVWGRVFAAMMRHAWKWWGGEKYDQEDGQHHLSSVAWCAFVLMEYEETHLELDDRPRRINSLIIKEGLKHAQEADDKLFYGRHKMERHVNDIVNE